MAAEGAFDATIHAPLRLRICGLLRPVGRLDFAVLRDTLQLSDATLSKNLRLLGDVGYVDLAKAPSPARADFRRMTWVSLTPAGRHAFDEHLQALQTIASGEAVPPSPRPSGLPSATGDVAPGAT